MKKRRLSNGDSEFLAEKSAGITHLWKSPGIRSFFRVFARRDNFLSTQNFFRSRENFGKTNLGCRDRFCRRIVEIGAILAIFEPFEN